ncbi:tetratricopeptide repeat protein [Actinoplanes sp. NPDC051851]|uniref:ATP-binding protein n=1 Tax=Actinoplanes sp. NPDC051851 TaxID=3154753 RepID=UPI00341792FB
MFSAQVRAYRLRGGMSQEDLAASTGVSVRSIRNLESGRITNPRPGTVRLLADAFGLQETERDRFYQSALDQSALDAEPVSPARPRPVPAQLPADVAGFVGREDQLRRLTALLDGGEQRVAAIAGTAGVGKSALAVHWAHRTLDRFPDGQLYVNLRGYDVGPPAAPGEVLARFLGALGTADADIPADLDERAARYRTALAGRRMLIVLDNAAVVEHVRPLLPGTGSCMVLVTSRDSLAGLVAVHGAERLDLDLFPDGDAAALLRRLIGTRVDDDPDAAAALADQCAHLPLALRVAAELTVARPTTTLAELVAELADQQRRWDLLNADGDPRAAVAAVFSWSIRHLPAEAARAFRLLGLHPGPDFDAYAAAALAGIGLADARRVLDRLVRAHLVQLTRGGRATMHDLLRAYAVSLAAAEEPLPERLSAATRLADHYLAATVAATERLGYGREGTAPEPAGPVTVVPDFPDPSAALRWLDAARAGLVQVIAHTAGHGMPTHTVRLATALYRYLEGGHYLDGLTIHGHARDAARQLGDPAAEAHALLAIGALKIRLGRPETAPTADMAEALVLYRRTGDRIGEGRALTNLGVAEDHLGRYAAAAERLEQALVLYRATGHRHGEAIALHNLGVAERHLGHYPAAIDRLEQALAVYRQLGYPPGEGMTLHNIGLAEERRGRFATAAEHQQEALTLLRQAGYPRGEAWALYGLGTARTRLGAPEEATALLHRALALFQEFGERDGEARAQNGLGEAALALGLPEEAAARHAAVPALTAVPDQRARAYVGLGHAHRALGDPGLAREAYRKALILHTEIGLPETGAVHAHLAALGD